ncbi:hypothetical protein FRC11_002157 [Ceratobasidium sp. 423]|nr:hypothetical protein FRC11_002157 [Ceratobasidium sp. 423]
MNAEDTKTILAEGVAGLALAASALAEAAQALSEAAAALSAMGQETRPPPTIYQSVEITPRLSEIYQIGNKNGKTQEIHDEANSVGASIGNNAHKRDATPEINFDGDSEQTNPFTHPRDPAPTANHSQAQGEYSSEPKHP